jgi:L-lactate dehydrogenase (cytochrome)
MPAPITNIEDLRVLARRRIPKALFDYVDGGSYDQLTLRANRADLDAVRLRQRVMIDTSRRDLSTTLLGEKVAMPVVIAPTGLTGLIHGDGEILAARAAEKAGLKFCLSTLSICTIEDVASAVKQPIWYQLYVFKDRGFARAMIDRAAAAGCTTIFLTVDLPYRGQRHADIKNGLTVPPRLTLRNCWDVATKPSWAMSVLMSKRKSFGNLDSYLGSRPGYAASVLTTGSWATQNSDQSLNWRDLDWIREHWKGKLVSRAFSTPRMPRPPRKKASTGSWCRTTAAASSMAPPDRSRYCRTSRTRSAIDWKCCSTAEFARGTTCSRRSPMARAAA